MLLVLVQLRIRYLPWRSCFAYLVYVGDFQISIEWIRELLIRLLFKHILAAQIKVWLRQDILLVERGSLWVEFCGIHAGYLWGASFSKWANLMALSHVVLDTADYISWWFTIDDFSLWLTLFNAITTFIRNKYKISVLVLDWNFRCTVLVEQRFAPCGLYSLFWR